MKRDRKSKEHVLLHEAAESCRVCVWLDRRQGFLVLAQQDRLREPLDLLREVPLLKVVNDGDVVDARAVHEAVFA